MACSMYRQSTRAVSALSQSRHRAPRQPPQWRSRDLRLLNGGAADDQPAITDEVAFVTAPDGQQGDPRCRRCRELVRDDFPGALNRRRPVTAFGVKDAELIGVRLGPWLQSQPLGLKVEWHRLVRRHGPSLYPGHGQIGERLLSGDCGQRTSWPPGRRKLHVRAVPQAAALASRAPAPVDAAD